MELVTSYEMKIFSRSFTLAMAVIILTINFDAKPFPVPE